VGKNEWAKKRGGRAAHGREIKRGEVGRGRFGPRRCFLIFKMVFYFSCFDSNPILIQIRMNSTRTLKLKHSINSKQNASIMKCNKKYINPKLI
jgi:hypothetical protein